MKNKWLVRLTIMVAICFSMLLIATPALAIWEWCEVDPIIKVDGHTVSIQSMVQGDPLKVSRADVFFVVNVPHGIHTDVVYVEKNAKLKITDDEHLTIHHGDAVVFDVTLSVETRSEYPMKLVVSVDGKVVKEIVGNTEDELHTYITLP